MYTICIHTYLSDMIYDRHDLTAIFYDVLTDGPFKVIQTFTM